MNFRPVHQNLDTSFVNLSALIKYLRRRQFAGIVRVKLNNYEAEIHITDENQMNIREEDHLSGRVSEGEEALQRILIRSREPGGIVNVFQKVSADHSQKVSENKTLEKIAEVPEKKQIPESKLTQTVSVSPEQSNKSANPANLKSVPTKTVQFSQTDTVNAETHAPKTTLSLPDFPFRLSNNVEAKAQQTKISDDKFQTSVELFAEILGTIDKNLATANLNFSAAFAKACGEIGKDYPFLNAEENIFYYKNGEIKISGQINPNQFTSSQLEAVRRVLEKLGANPKFAELYRATVQNLLALIRQRKPLYDEFAITPKLEKIIGV